MLSKFGRGELRVSSSEAFFSRLCLLSLLSAALYFSYQPALLSRAPMASGRYGEVSLLLTFTSCSLTPRLLSFWGRKPARRCSHVHASISRFDFTLARSS